MILRHRKEQKLRDWTNRFWRLRWKNEGNSIMNTLPFNTNQVNATSNFNGWKPKAMRRTLLGIWFLETKNLFILIVICRSKSNKHSLYRIWSSKLFPILLQWCCCRSPLCVLDSFRCNSFARVACFARSIRDVPSAWCTLDVSSESFRRRGSSTPSAESGTKWVHMSKSMDYLVGRK
jgi:hypothetical protein